MPVLLAAWYCWQQRVHLLAEANQAASRSVVALEEHAANMLDVHLLILQELDDATRGRSGDEVGADERLRRRVAGLTVDFPQVSIVGVADAVGRVWLSSSEAASRTSSVADRGFFLAHKESESSSRSLYISEAFTGRLNNARQFGISLRRSGPSGEFNGIVFATVPVKYLADFWEEFTPSAGHLITLVRGDGALLARYPAAVSLQRFAPDGPFMTRLRLAPAGLYTAVSAIDGIERIIAYSQIKNYPLFIGFGTETAFVLGQWRKESIVAACIAIFSALTLAALWLAVVRQSHDQRVSSERWQLIAGDLKVQVERRKDAEDAMRQSQKMEAVGQLAGGIAHDFNNLLAALMGNVQLMQRRLEQGLSDDLPRYVAAIQSITDKASAMTQRLLSFSRRQTLSMGPVDVRARIDGMYQLISQTVGPAIRVQLNFGGHALTTFCDPNQLDSALLNLAVNARDAMPGGGALVISAERTSPADDQAPALQLHANNAYVVLRVQDNGIGMAPEVVQRVFEPFFTTKPSGHGTGLGMSMVYGFVTQSGGQIRINSAPGAGTEVALYLPAYEEEVAPSKGPSEVPESRPPVGDLCVVLVDDEIAVREPMAELLVELGYRVIQAGDAAQGLAVLRTSERVDLLVSDIGLPGSMNGRQFAAEALKLRPRLKVLFVTGYGNVAVTADDLLSPDIETMFKPFGFAEFAQKVSAMTSERTDRSAEAAVS